MIFSYIKLFINFYIYLLYKAEHMLIYINLSK